MGVPLSSTHCNIGALYGMFLASYFEWFKEVYPENKQKGDKSINNFVVLKIIVWWLITVPVAFTTTFIITYMILLF